MSDEVTIEDGATVYTEDGAELGVITGSTTDGFAVSVNEEVEYVAREIESDEAERAGGEEETEAIEEESRGIEPQESDPGPAFGEGFLMWRCDDCGEMGELEEGLPETCPNCGSEAVNKWKED